MQILQVQIWKMLSLLQIVSEKPIKIKEGVVKQWLVHCLTAPFAFERRNML